MDSASPSYKGHRYPVEVISHCVWLYFRFPLSFREVEEPMLQRGVIVSYETVRRWCATFGQAYADGLRGRRPGPGDTWHPDGVFTKVNGEPKCLRRAVDADGDVLDVLVQNRRYKAAARRFFRHLTEKTRAVPRVVVTDKLRSYRAAHREVVPSVEHRQSKYLNNRAENSHQPTRQRERAMKGFRSVGGAQRSLSASSGISPHFRPPPSPDERARLPSRDDQPLHDLGPDHRRHRPAHHNLTTASGRGPTCRDAPSSRHTRNNVTTPSRVLALGSIDIIDGTLTDTAAGIQLRPGPDGRWFPFTSFNKEEWRPAPGCSADPAAAYQAARRARAARPAAR